MLILSQELYFSIMEYFFTYDLIFIISISEIGLKMSNNNNNNKNLKNYSSLSYKNINQKGERSPFDNN